ncbi:hypothetical protein, partial [Bifidobacterium breve]
DSRQDVAGVDVLWRASLEMTKLPHHPIWKMVLHNVEADKGANIAPKIFIMCAHWVKIHIKNFFPCIRLPSNLDMQIGLSRQML